MASPAAASGKRLGRPVLDAPRSCVVYARLTTPEYEALLALVPARCSLSDFCRELLSEAALARLRAHERSAAAGARSPLRF